MMTGTDLNINAGRLLQLGDGDVQEILKYYDVTPDMLEESLENIRAWYKMQPHLPQGELSENKLFRHLAIRGFSIERTKEKIDHYFTSRNVCAELTTNRDPCSPAIERAFDVFQFITLPQKIPEHHRVTIYRIVNDDPSMAVVWDFFKLIFMVADYRLENDLCLGEHICFDLSNLKMGHVLQVTPSVMRKSNFYVHKCIGAKIKGVHIVGLPTYAETMVAMFKKGVPKKVAERIYTYGKFEDLKNTFPVRILPKDLGGEEMSSNEIAALWKETLQSPQWRQWFLEQDNVRTDESKRPKNSSNASAEELLGMHGSFRKLDLD